MRELRRSPLEAHHRAWLKAHPERSKDWLRERLADVFIITPTGTGTTMMDRTWPSLKGAITSESFIGISTAEPK